MIIVLEAVLAAVRTTLAEMWLKDNSLIVAALEHAASRQRSRA